MSDIQLDAQMREPGRSTARSLRRDGAIPGIYYFHGEDSISIAVDELALRPLIQTSESRLVNLKLDDGTEKLCILKDMVFDPITDRPVHFDLMGVAAGELIKVYVAVHLVGRAAGLAEGGLVQHQLNEIEIEVLPKNLPEHVEVDVSGLNIGDSLHVGDIDAGDFTILTPDNITIVSVSAPRVADEDAGEGDLLGEAGSAEPEVIGKGKKEDEGSDEG